MSRNTYDPKGNLVIKGQSTWQATTPGGNSVVVDVPMIIITPVKESFFTLLGLEMVKVRIYSGHSFPEGHGYSTYLEIKMAEPGSKFGNHTVLFINPEDSKWVIKMPLLEFIDTFKELIPNLK